MRLFDVVLRDGFKNFVPHTPLEETLLKAPHPKARPEVQLRYAKLTSRLGRLLNIARAPFAMTLFLDDDTSASGPKSLGASAPRGGGGDAAGWWRRRRGAGRGDA